MPIIKSPNVAFSELVADLLQDSIDPMPFKALFLNTLPGQVENGIPAGGYLLHTLFGAEALDAHGGATKIFDRSDTAMTFRLYAETTTTAGSVEAMNARDTMMQELRVAIASANNEALYGPRNVVKYNGIETAVQFLHQTTDYLVDNILCVTMTINLRAFV